jgi:predicted DNA-binding transcriptional regulator YafY
MRYGEDECAVERLVDPLGLVAKGSVWYLVAAIAGDVRTYRVSRVQEATITEDPFVRPEGFDLESYWQQSATRFKELMPRYHVVIRAEASSMQWIRALVRFGAIDEVTPDERDGSNRIAMHFDAPEVARAFVLGLGDAAEVIEPPELRASVREAAQRLINRYEGRIAAADRAPTAS